MSKWIVVAVALLLGSTVCAIVWTSPAPTQPLIEPYRPAEKKNPVTYTIRALYVFTPVPGTKVAHLWLVRPPNDAGQEVLFYQTHPRPEREVVDADFGNRLLYFRFPDPNGAITVECRMRVRVWDLFWNLDPQRVVQEVGKVSPLWTRSERYIIASDQRVQSLARQMVSDSPDFASSVFAILKGVIEEMDYSHENCSLVASALHALENREGHCSDYHGLGIALLRSLKIPSRLTYGYKVLNRQSPSHCMLEVYLPPYGWVPFDLSETDKLLTKLEDLPLTEREKQTIRRRILNRFLSGWRPNVWFRSTIGSDIPIQPAIVPNPPVIRTAYLAYDNRVVPDPDPANRNASALTWQLVWDVQADRIVKNPWDLSYWLKE
ncbi:MAG: transglutaminase family protein [Armatimonadetes bacterium]|nr:transglutaminase family protein [Armatimonadota bacterium]MDW8120759.1 transglutaminase family protein [Armatimonadota bacterium]